MSSGPAHPGDPFFGALGDRLGRSYLRYSFAQATGAEVDFIERVTKLRTGGRILDVGCGPGRHAIALAQRGARVAGVDASRRFLDVAAEDARAAGVKASFYEVDARQMPFDDEFDVVLSLQGAFGFMGRDDALVLRRMAEAARPGGLVLLTAANAYFVVRNLPEGSVLDPDQGVLWERTVIRTDDGRDEEAELWTSIYTPRELRLLAIGVGLVPEEVWAAAPGDLSQRPPDDDHPELLLLARKPPAT